MADSIRVQVQGAEQIIRKLQELGRKAPRAVISALNDTAVHVRQLATDDIRSEWNLKSGTVKQLLRILVFCSAFSAHSSEAGEKSKPYSNHAVRDSSSA